MGARRHGQGAGGHLPPSGNVVVFCALVVTVKRSVDQLLFYVLFSKFFVGFCWLRSLTPTGTPLLDPAGGISSPDPLIYPPLEKILRVPMLP